MASASSARKVPCAMCDGKDVGVIKCEGCSQIFCHKHADQHRDNLHHQFDKIINEHNAIQYKIRERKGQQLHRHPSVLQIDQWERDSIARIQQAAAKARQELIQSIKSHTDFVSDQLQHLTRQLQKAREDAMFIETDLRTWEVKLEELSRILTNVRFSINIPSETLITPLIGQLPISIETPFRERFQQFSGDIQIFYDGREARHGPSGRNNAYVRGAGEYSSGKHRIRFLLNKKSAEYSAAFGIVSKQTGMASAQSWYKPSPIYGWNTLDNVIDGEKWVSQDNSDQLDMSGKSSFEIELFLDCDNRRIFYVNAHTGKTNELSVDTGTCPFPWQFECYLFDIDDYVRLLPS